MEQLVRSGPAKQSSGAPAPTPMDTTALSTARAYALFGWHGAPPSTEPGALGNVLYCTLCGAARMLGSPDAHTAAMAQRAAEAAAQAAALRGTTLGTPGPLRLAGAGGGVQVASGPAQTIAGGALQCSPGQVGGAGHADGVPSADQGARPASTAWRHASSRSEVVSASSFTTWMAGFGSSVSASSGPVSASPARGPFGGGEGVSAPLFGVAAMRASTGGKRQASPGDDDDAARWVEERDLCLPMPSHLDDGVGQPSECMVGAMVHHGMRTMCSLLPAYRQAAWWGCLTQLRTIAHSARGLPAPKVRASRGPL